MKFSEAKSVAEVEGTEKSLKFRKTARRAIIALVIIVALIGVTIMVADWKNNPKSLKQLAKAMVSAQADIPLASQPVAEWPKLVLPPGGRSEDILVPPGMSIQVKGHRAKLHTVYTDGHESVISVESDESNPDGAIAKEYVTNDAKESNIVSYAFK